MKYIISMRHTSGPWHTAKVGNAVVVSTKVKGLLARVPFKSPYCPIDADERTANAHLMAKAPDLLALCIESLHILEDMDIAQNLSAHLLVKSLRRAVAEVESPSSTAA